VPALAGDHRCITPDLPLGSHEVPVERSADLTPTGLALAGSGTRYHITGPDERAHNTPGQPRVVDIHTTENVATNAALRVPALSNAVFVLPLK